MSDLRPFEREIAKLIITSLNLDDTQAEDIVPEEALFNEGLGLDSIDALELSMTISKQYGFQLRSDSKENAQIFSSLRSLSAYIESNRQ
jgi:acyl carrier protein